MTEDLEKLIEHIKAGNEETLRRLREVFLIDDPVERFRALESWDDPSLSWAVVQAKAVTIEEIQRDPSAPSLKAVGNLLGISPQRVHQLKNPDARRTQWQTRPTPKK